MQALVTTDEPAPPRERGTPDPMRKKEAKPKDEEMGEVDGLPVQALWPLGIVAAGGGLFALYKLDPTGFEPLFEEAVKVHRPHVPGSCLTDVMQLQ